MLALHVSVESNLPCSSVVTVAALEGFSSSMSEFMSVEVPLRSCFMITKRALEGFSTGMSELVCCKVTLDSCFEWAQMLQFHISSLL